MSFKRTQFHPETDPDSLRFYDYWFKVKATEPIEFDGDISGTTQMSNGRFVCSHEEEGVVKFVPTHLVPINISMKGLFKVQEC